MVRLKKSSIITTAILIGTLTIGGTVYAVVQNNQYQEALENATNQIEIEQDTLDALYKSLEGYELDNGYLSEELTTDVLAEVENSLNSIKDSYIDFHIEKDDLKDGIKVIKLDKKEVEQKMASLNSKLELQERVNNLFEGEVLVGSEVSKQAITDKLTRKEVEQIKNEDLAKVEEASEWKDTLESTLKNATSQLDQIELANKKVDAVHKDDKVVSGVSRGTYTEAKTEVDKVKNESIKKGLATRLTSVLKVVEADELKVKEEAEEKARQEAEAVAQAEAQAQSSQGSTGTAGTYSEGSSTAGTAPTSNNASASKGASSSTSTQTQPSNKHSSASSSQSKPKTNSNSGGQTSKPSSSKGSIEKTGGGKIKNHGEHGAGGENTYEEWTFDEDFWNSINK